MSNHFSADYLKSPGDDRRLDLTDLFAFKSSKDPDKLILIVNSNPTAPAPAPVQARGPEFYPGAVYRINVDTDSDARADVAFTFTFSQYQGGRQTGTARYATGPQARQPEPAGEVLAGPFQVSFDGMAPKRPRRPPCRCCPTSCATTAPSPPSTPTAAGPSRTSTATASPG